VCVPILPAAVGVIGGRIIEGADRAACLSYAGSYDQAPAVHDALRHWMTQTGARAAGPLRERYLRFGADQRGYSLPKRFISRNPSHNRTEMQIPVART
jgi:effector-binding domain-containing protein